MPYCNSYERRQVSMITRSVSVPGFFYVSNGSIYTINEILQSEGIELTKSLIVSGQSFTKSIGDLVASSIDGEQSRIYIDDNSIESIQKVEHQIRDTGSSLVIGVGGGKVLDVTKYCAYKLGKSFLAIPTVLSNDGISSPVAVVDTDQGVSSIGTNPPVGIVVDINVIKNSPKKTVLAGIGDLISNISAVDDWNLAGIYNGEKVDKFAEILAKNSAEGFVRLLDKKSIDITEDTLLTSLAEGLIQSGIAMSLAGSSRPCSGSEHLISHALDHLLNYSKLHGIQVGFATLFTSALRKKEFRDLAVLYKKIGFPTTLKELGLSREIFQSAVRNAPNTRKGRFTILNLVSEKEIEVAIDDAYGS
jgi:glycerol-1-phosphate dehydrogenase [NAD(P)+]